MRGINVIRACLCVALLSLGVPALAAPDVPAMAPAATEAHTVERGEVAAWLARAQEASRKRSYVGTFVVMSASGAMATSRIWHATEGDQQVERMDAPAEAAAKPEAKPADAKPETAKDSKMAPAKK